MAAREWRAALGPRFLSWAIAISLLVGLATLAPLLASLTATSWSVRRLAAASISFLVLAPPILAPLLVHRMLGGVPLDRRLEELSLTPTGAIPAIGARLLVPAITVTLLHMSVFVTAVGILIATNPSGHAISYLLFLCFALEILLGTVTNVLVLGTARLRGLSWRRVLIFRAPILLPLHVCGLLVVLISTGVTIGLEAEQTFRMESGSVVARVGLTVWAAVGFPSAAREYIRREVYGDEA